MTEENDTTRGASRDDTRDLGDLVVEAMRARRDRERGLMMRVEGRAMTTAAAALVEVLATSTSEDFDETRDCFPHRISSADRSTLARVRALLIYATDAITRNDGDALAEIVTLTEKIEGIDTTTKKMAAARAAVEHAIAAFAARPTAAAELLFLLVKLDPLFGDLDTGQVSDLLSRAHAPQDIGNVGRGMLGAPAVLAKLMFKCGAFGADSYEDAHESVKNAKRNERLRKR